MTWEGAWGRRNCRAQFCEKICKQTDNIICIVLLKKWLLRNIWNKVQSFVSNVVLTGFFGVVKIQIMMKRERFSSFFTNTLWWNGKDFFVLRKYSMSHTYLLVKCEMERGLIKDGEGWVFVWQRGGGLGGGGLGGQGGPVSRCRLNDLGERGKRRDLVGVQHRVNIQAISIYTQSCTVNKCTMAQSTNMPCTVNKLSSKHCHQIYVPCTVNNPVMPYTKWTIHCQQIYRAL